jgi:hypothetical protein
MSTTQIDEKRSEAFAQQLVGALNGAATTLMTSIGHRTGLFDVLAVTGALTSEQLAQQAGLNERYVREWLSAQAAKRPFRFGAIYVPNGIYPQLILTKLLKGHALQIAFDLLNSLQNVLQVELIIPRHTSPHS